MVVIFIRHINFADMQVNWLGFDLSRYELNALVGLFVSCGVFVASAFLNRRAGAFKGRIEALEKDLQTPAYADEEDKLGTEGLKAYKIMGALSIGLGGLLLLLAFPTLNDGGWLNALVGAIAVAIGFIILKAVGLYKQKNRPSTISPKHTP